MHVARRLCSKLYQQTEQHNIATSASKSKQGWHAESDDTAPEGQAQVPLGVIEFAKKAQVAEHIEDEETQQYYAYVDDHVCEQVAPAERHGFNLVSRSASIQRVWTVEVLLPSQLAKRAVMANRDACTSVALRACE